jgi:hypothetical protein
LGLPHRLTGHLHLAVVRVHRHSAGGLVGDAGDKGLGWKGAPGSEDPAVDKFHGARLTTVHALVAPTSLDLSAYGDDVIARVAQLHAECPPTPESVESTTVGSDPAMFIAWNCGILVNLVVGLHGDEGYQFVFRDPSLHEDATDRSTFESMLDTVSFGP